MPFPPFLYVVHIATSFAWFQNAELEQGEEGRREKECTHIRRRRITHRKSHVWAKRKAGEKAREGQKGSWYPPFGRDSIRGERQTATQRATLLPPPPDHAFSTYRHNCHNIVPHTYSLLLHLHTPASVPSPTPSFSPSPETASFPRRVDRKFNRTVFRIFPTRVSTIFEPRLIPGESFLFVPSDAHAFRDRYEDLTRFKGVTRNGWRNVT